MHYNAACAVGLNNPSAATVSATMLHALLNIVSSPEEMCGFAAALHTA